MAGDDLGDLADERRHLRLGRAHEGERLADERVERGAVEGQPVVGGEPVEEVVAGGALLAHRERHRDRVLLDGLVGHLAADAGPHRAHEHLGGGEERQVALELPRR